MNLSSPGKVRALIWAILVGVILTGSAGQAFAQQYPAMGYYALQRENSVYHMGELRDAQRALVNLYRGAYREGNVRWLDSAAYQAVAGELSFQMGDYDRAMAAYSESALIYLNMIGWPTRVDWARQQAPQIDNNAVRKARISWGQPTRPTQIGRFPSSYSVRFGRDIVVPNDQGNTIIPQERLVPVDVIEICRAVAFGLHRRDEILGPLSSVDETSRLLRAQLGESRNLVAAGVPVTLSSILYGIALAGDGEFRKSSEILNSHLQIDGLDHPLTPVALMQIGYNQYMTGDYRAAKATLGEASFSAAFFEQYDVFRESLILASKAHMAVNRDQPLPELQQASEWARLHGLRMAQAQFAMVSAENDIENGLPESAIQSLQVARSMMRTTTLARSAQASRLELLERIANVIAGLNDDVMSLRKVLEDYRVQTLWWYRVEYLRTPAKRRNLTTTLLSTLVQVIARDPLPDDWARDPISTLAFLTGDRSDFILDDLDIQISKSNFDDALLTSELSRRMEFLYRCPLGGRLTAIRELVTRQPAELTPDLLGRQTEVRSRFSGFEALMTETQEIRKRLEAMPVNPAEAQERDWLSIVDQWQRNGRAMERGFINLSVRREAVPILFPPPVDLELLQQSMPEKTICMVIKRSRGVYHVFLVTRDTIAFQTTLNAGNVTKAVQGLAKAWGHTNTNAVLRPEVVKSSQWKNLSHFTLKALVPKSTPQFWDGFDELVVIPDGQFWYLPFETLALEGVETSELLIDKVAVRYAPSFSLAFGEQKPRRLNRVAFYPGMIDARDDETKAATYAEELVNTWPKVMKIERSQLTPAEIGPMVDAMVLWSEIRDTNWPTPQKSTSRKNEQYRSLNLDRWPYLPNGGPNLLMVSGANTAMANNARGQGDELGYYATLLMAAGCKSVVLPRWRSGGDLAYQNQIKLSEALQKNHQTAIAWREVIQSIRQQTLDPENQPRLRLSKQDTDVSADHPFFWATHMVIDRGQWYDRNAIAQEAPLKLGGSNAQEEGGNQAEGEDDKTPPEKPPQAQEGGANDGNGMPNPESVPPAVGPGDGQKKEAGAGGDQTGGRGNTTADG